MMCEGKSFYIWLMQVIGLLGLIVLFLWLSLRPQSPSYSILSISVEGPSGQNGSDTIFYSLEIENPNKESSIYYDDIVLGFLYGQQEDEVGETTIGSFHQGTGKTRVVSDSVNGKPRTFRPLLSAISNATAELKVALTTRFRYKTWGIESKFHGLHLRGILPIDSDGKLSRKKKKYPLTHNSQKLGRSKVKRHWPHLLHFFLLLVFSSTLLYPFLFFIFLSLLIHLDRKQYYLCTCAPILRTDSCLHRYMAGIFASPVVSINKNKISIWWVL